LADGNIIVATPDKNSDIFYGAIGGYGGIGMIVDATLKLQKNEVLERVYEDMNITEYGAYFKEHIRDNTDTIFHNADMYPPLFHAVRTTSWQKSSKEATTTERLIPRDTSYPINQIAYSVMAHCKYGKWIRQHILDPIVYRKTEVHNRNYEASYDVAELEPKSRKKDSYILEEYFCPVDRIDEFIPKMREIFSRHDANIINISIRHALPDSGSVLAWAQEEVFAFVVYYNQETDESARKEVAVWTRELIDAVISV
jgi:FAD/FMN-containing dehydrogenase